ncbi:MAG: beta-lactamase family protein [Saprospiraceae bacterium]|nr:beta-lactamase family protein [Saprospiraceae bacterium]
MRKRILLIPGLILCLGIFLNYEITEPRPPVKKEQKATPPPVPAPLKAFAQQYESYIEQRLQQDSVPALAMAIVKDSFLLSQKCWGVQDINRGQAINDSTVFRIASLSKGFAPVLTGILVQEGQLDWDDRVKEFLPDFRLKDSTATQNLTLAHVLSHTTGLPRHTYSNLLNMEVPYEEIKQMLPNVAVAHPVGTYYNYQNVAYCLIGDVLQAKTGETYDELMRQRIFKPLNMTQADLGYPAFQQNNNKAYPHKRIANGYARKELENTFFDVSPAAGIHASITDMQKWLSLLLGNHPEIIQPATLDSIFEPRIRISTRERHFRAWRLLESAHYAMGWRVLQRNGKRIIWHSGYVNGYRAEIAFEPASGYGIVLLSSAANALVRDALPDFFDRLDKIEGEQNYSSNLTE